jgi:hypothetical protein
MPSTAAELAALGSDQQFQMRVRSIVIQVAEVVIQEPPATPDARRNFAKQMISNPDTAARLAIPVANMVNLKAGTTSYDFEAAHVVTDVSDDALFSQITAAWDLLSGAA